MSIKGSMFTVIQIETIHGCNLRCWHCPNKDVTPSGELMTREAFDQIIGELAELGFAGEIRPYLMNEPFMDARMGELARSVRERVPQARCIFNTNGMLLTDEVARELCELEVKLRISAYDSRTLERFRRLHLRTSHVTDYRDTRKEWPAFFCNRAGSVEIPGQEPQGGRCDLPFSHLYVRLDGRAVLCCNDWFSAVVVGNVLEDGLLATFRGQVLRNYRRALKAGVRKPPLCEQCSYVGVG
jgi:hypothetical protein